MSKIRIDHVTKRFGSFTAVDDIAMTFPGNAVTCLLGPSGCGKTTLMRMIAGLERSTAGRILFGGRDVTELPPRRRNVGVVFQYPVMYQTLTVAQNIRLPLYNDRSLSEAERRVRLEEVLDVLQMADRADATIAELDAGRAGRRWRSAGRWPATRPWSCSTSPPPTSRSTPSCT